MPVIEAAQSSHAGADVVGDRLGCNPSHIDRYIATTPAKVCALIYEFDEFQFEPRNARLSRRGVLLHTEPKAMQVLEVLLDGHGSLVDRDTLLNLVWGRVIVTPGTLTRLIAELRRVLGDDPLKPRFIETIHTKGYRWIAAVASAKRTMRRSGPPERSIELIGRDEDLTQLQVIAATSRLLTLAGPGGTGKTQLALELARRRESQQPNSVVWIDLTAASDERALPGLITTALDVQLPDGVGFCLRRRASGRQSRIAAAVRQLRAPRWQPVRQHADDTGTVCRGLHRLHEPGDPRPPGRNGVLGLAAEAAELLLGII